MPPHMAAVAGTRRHDGGARQEEPCQPSVVLGAAEAARVRGDRDVAWLRHGEVVGQASARFGLNS